ncbi:spore coat protein U domain-containing protein [Chitinibacter bivalviorum]|uniref:Spore coat protein U domain-containing protein n=1 Tax=Chitinibacter bivalviorum TaxID=2739434 RepID=A0A7H9BQF2_9NEIS|nr:spore coat U domain-containing protein [Chitinibacter bivalviorum]QLG89474.1 spore coat protein U domain-containing protein [Chitinibacter bivalviorum]
MKKLGCTFALFAIFLAPPALAASCSISSLPDGDLGLYDPQSTVADIVRQFSLFVTCSAATQAKVTAGPSFFTGSEASRSMRNDSNADVLNYQLFLDSNCTRIFGTADPNAATASIANAGGQARVNFWTKIYGNQTSASPGTYRDYITLTVTP